MEYKFKTVHKGKLIDCYLIGGLVFIEAVFLCRKDTDEISCANVRMPLKDAPVFQYIGRKDINGEEIYTGHQLILSGALPEEEKDLEIYMVIFERIVSGFVLKNDSNQLMPCDDRLFFMKIAGHSDLETLKRKIELKPVRIPGRLSHLTWEKNENN